MLDAKKQAELAQMTAFMGESYPPLLWNLYTGFMEEGFTSEVSLELVKTALMAMLMTNKGGIDES